MSEQMKNAYNLAPFVAEALREVAAEATFPDTDEREWTEEDMSSRDYAVCIAEAALSEDYAYLGGCLLHSLRRDAEAARDAAMDPEG